MEVYFVKKWMKAGVSVFSAAAIAASMVGVPATAFAAGGLGGETGDTTNWKVPTSQKTNTVTVNGKLNKVITTWANAWALSGPDYLGVSNSGALDQQGGGAGSTTLSQAQQSTMLGVWASAANEVPNAYNWNYFYNLALTSVGKDTVDTAVVDVQNGSVAGFDSASGVWAPFKYRPEIVWTSNSLSAADASTFSKLIKEGKYYGSGANSAVGGDRNTHTFNADSDDAKNAALDASAYAIDGDSSYDPKVISAQTASAFTFVDSFYELAGMAEEVETATAGNNADGAVTDKNVTWKTMNSLPRTTRYEASSEDALSARECATNIEKVTRGAIYYTLQQIDAGAVSKKKVAFLTGDPDTSAGTATVVAYSYIDQIGGGADSGKASFAPLTVNQLTSSKKVADGTCTDGSTYTTYTVTADELASCDYVVDTNGSLSSGALKRWVVNNATTSSLSNKASKSVEYLTQLPAIMNGHNFTSEKLLWGVYNIDFFYPELFPNMELTSYWYDSVYHLKTSSIKTAMQYGLGNATLPSSTSLSQLTDGYTQTDMDVKFKQGYDYYKSTLASAKSYDSSKKWSETTFAATDDYAKWAGSYKVQTVGISGTASYSKNIGSGSFALDAKANVTGAKLTYKSSNTKVATVNSAGKVTIAGIGTAKITVAGSASEWATGTKTITVKVSGVGKTKITSLKSKKKGTITVKAKKVTGQTGFQIKYQVSGKKAKTVKVKTSKALNKTISKLKAGKKVKVQVRAYTTAGGKTYYGSYVSKTVKVHK